jgi:predicted house-cleaning noncanonical NTP pyrophosphatase (MazG superfamily)
MRIFRMKKLVRDKIVERMEGDGNKVDSKILNDKEYIDELKSKLKEELIELNEVKFGDKENFKNELADIQLLVDYLLKVNKISKKELLEFKKEKADKMGGFDKRIFVDTVNLLDDDEWVEYYIKKGFEEVK